MMYGLFVLLGFASSLLSSVFGFGSAMVVLALGPYLLPVHQVIALSAILFAASTLTKTFAFRSSLNWPLTGYMTLGSLPFAYLGGLLLPHLSSLVLQRCLGILILGYVCSKLTVTKAAIRWLQQRNATAQVNNTIEPVKALTEPGKVSRKIQLITVAASYGFTSGLVGSGSLIKALFFRQLGLEKEAFVGTMAATSVVATIGKITAYTQTGLLHGKLLQPMLALTVAAIVAVLIGRHVLQRIDSNSFNRGVTLLLTFAGVGLLL